MGNGRFPAKLIVSDWLGRAIMQLRIWIITILLAAGLAACAPESVPTPQPTPKTELAEPIPVTLEHIELTLTATSIPTNTPPPTEVPIPTNTPLAEATATSLPELVWSENLEFKTKVGSDTLVWSPVKNEFIFDMCQSYLPEKPENPIVWAASPPDYIPIDISPLGVVCNSQSKFIWKPDGMQIVFNGISKQSPIAIGDFQETSTVIIMNRDGKDVTETDFMGNMLTFFGWMNNKTIVFHDYSGGGHRWVSMVNIERIDRTAWAFIHAGFVESITSDFVIMNTGGDPTFQYSVAAFSKTAVGEMIPFGQVPDPFQRILSIDTNQVPYKTYFNSRYEDTLPNSNQILVLTWDAEDHPQGDIISGGTITNLQIWDLATDDFKMFMPGGIYGRFSPNGSIIAAMTPDDSHPNLQLFSYPDDEKFLSLPAYAEANEYTTEVYAFTTFSPNCRYFTFFTPETDLVVYDIQTGDMIPPITAVPAEPLWSPDNTRFVYTDPEQGLSIYDTSTHATYLLAEMGGERLSNPQWSFDGTYLSVTYRTEDHEWETAVISLP